MKQLTAFLLLTICISGCSFRAGVGDSRDTFIEYLESRKTEFESNKDALCRNISNIQTVFDKTSSGVSKATVTFSLIIQASPDGGIINSSQYAYVLYNINDSWTVVESRIKNINNHWMQQSDFHKESDPIFSELPWCLK